MATLPNPYFAYRIEGAGDDEWTIVEVSDGAFPETVEVAAETTYEFKKLQWSASRFVTSGEAQFDFYVDSAQSDDMGDGTTAATAKQTIAALAALVGTTDDLRLALAKDSDWSEALSLPDRDGISIAAYGEGAAPALSQIEVIAGPWTQPDAGGAPNVWQASVSHSLVNSITRLIVLEDGAMMPRQTSRANVNSNEGSRLSPSDGSLAANNPAIVEIHATGSGDPNSNGRVYSAIVREASIELGDGADITAVELDGAGNNNGTLIVGRTAILRRVIARNCGKHHLFVSGGSLLEDVVAIAGDVPIGTDGGQAFVITYDEAANGQSAVHRRCFCVHGSAIVQAANPISRNAFYAHSQAPELWDDLLYEQCASVDLLASGDFSAGDATTLRVHGCFVRGTDKAMTVGASAYSRAAEFLYNQGYRAQTGMFDFKPGGASAVTARHNVLYPWNWGLSRWMIDTNANVTGEFEYNTFVAPARYLMARFLGAVTHRFNLYVINDGSSFNVLTLPGGSTSDYNVYVNTGAGQLKYTYNGVEYANLAAYQAGTGQEANSLEFIGATLGDIFSGVPSNGDFRLNGGGTVGAQVVALGAGAQYHWDWATRAVASGPPHAWPDVPETVGEARTYQANPSSWDFYP